MPSTKSLKTLIYHKNWIAAPILFNLHQAFHFKTPDGTRIFNSSQPSNLNVKWNNGDGLRAMQVTVKWNQVTIVSKGKFEYK